MAAPHVSLVLCVQDGMPYLPEAVESVRAQTYRDFELLVQDGASTDGTLEYLRNLEGIPGLELVSEADGGVGDAYNRAFRRCRGEIIGTIDADNLLVPHTLERAVALFDEHPSAAAVYGGVSTIAADGAVIGPWVPAEFDVLDLLTCRLVPPFSTAFFSRARCGDALAIDEGLETCADFDLWLRLAHLEIVRTEEPLGATRLSEKSMSRRPERYDAFCRDKITALDRYLTRLGDNVVLDSVRRRAVAGVYAWAATSVYAIEGYSERVRGYESEAAARDPAAPALAILRAWVADAARAKQVAEDPAAEGVRARPPLLGSFIRSTRR